MAQAPITRHGFMRILGGAGSALVALSIAATPRHAVAILSRKSVLRKVAPLKSLKTGVNGPYAFAVDTTDALNTNNIFLVRGAHNKVTALEATCRHMGCQINWVGADKKFECPCHGSQYNMSGTVVQGPAQHNLYTHKVTVKAGQVWVLSTRASM
jgi:Rieske Fe-S protein